MFVEIVILILTLIAGFFVYFVYLINKEIQKYKHIPGPEPEGFVNFFLGNTNDFKEENAKGVIFSEIFFRLMKKYNTRIVKYRLLNNTMIVTSDPRIIKEVFIEQDCRKHPNSYQIMGFPGGARFMGNGLLTEVNNDRWKKRRPLFNPAFHKQCLGTFMDTFNRKGDVLIDHLKNLSMKQTEPITLLEKFNHCALDIIASVAFSMDIDTVNDPNNMFNKYIADALSGAYAYFVDPFMKLKPHKWSYINEHREKIKYLRDLGRKQIESRLEALKKGEEMPNDILTTILKTMESQDLNEFYVEDMIDEFITFFVAGQETTSSALTSTFLEIGRRPDILEKLRKEIDTIIGRKAEISFDDLQKLQYTKALFKETLRLYPPSGEPGVRISHADIKVDDIFLPKGSWILCSQYSSGRNENNYKDPFTYNPDRFMKDGETIQNYSFFPFAMGPRTCIGQNFAQIEAKLLIVKMIQNFDIKLDPNQSFDLVQQTSTRPKDGTRCFLTLRS